MCKHAICRSTEGQAATGQRNPPVLLSGHLGPSASAAPNYKVDRQHLQACPWNVMIATLSQSPSGSPEQLKSLKLGLDGIDIGDDSSDERPPPAPDDDRIHVRRPLKDILSDIPHTACGGRVAGASWLKSRTHGQQGHVWLATAGTLNQASAERFAEWMWLQSGEGRGALTGWHHTRSGRKTLSRSSAATQSPPGALGAPASRGSIGMHTIDAKTITRTGCTFDCHQPGDG